tara:strand:- start:2226 stop:3614 length:1389 start_codon:yes stop_codon:yes gene_type:complete
MGAISEWIKQHNIEDIECLVPGINGNAFGKLVHADKLIKEDIRLPEAVLLQSVTGGYPEEFEDILGVADSDMFLTPDPSAISPVPWAKKPTAQVIHDCYTREGKLHPLSSRGVLKRVIELFENEGWRPVVAPEIEFYLIHQCFDSRSKLQPATGRSGRAEKMRKSYTIEAIKEFDSLVEEVFLYCASMGLDADSIVDESGAAQMEVNFLHGDALNLTDQVFSFRRMLQETAMKHGIFATFMAKPMELQPGSSIHVHQSIIGSEDGKNIFVDEQGHENKLFRHYIGGLQKFTNAVMAFYAPNANSYRRFRKGSAAPINVDWGYDNRTVGIRVPDGSAESKRVENRFAGVDSNPYLVMAATLTCGYLGMKMAIEPAAPFSGSSYDEEMSLPRSLEQAMRLLSESQELREVFGDTFVDAFIAVKGFENEEFNNAMGIIPRLSSVIFPQSNRLISPWEREYLLLNV